jgi:hypothetical protein
MNEIQRQHYLEAIGIDTYMPRWILPSAASPFSCQPVLPQSEADLQAAAQAAAASSALVADSQMTESVAQPDRVVPEAMASVVSEAYSEPPQVAAAVAQEIPAKAAPLEVLASIDGTTETEKKSSTPVSAKSILEGLGDEKRPDPRFALSLWQINEHLMVIDSRHSELALPTEPLLRNILSALGFARQPLPKAEVLRWPMFENNYEPQGQAIARETLQAMLEGMLESQPCKYLLLMGAEACHYILSDTHVGEGFDPKASLESHLGQSFVMDAMSVSAIVVPSLNDMLQQPQLKRDTWRAIQPLRQQ